MLEFSFIYVCVCISPLANSNPSFIIPFDTVITLPRQSTFVVTNITIMDDNVDDDRSEIFTVTLTPVLPNSRITVFTHEAFITIMDDDGK